MTTTFTRLAGTDRTKTAAAVARATATTSATAVLVGADHPADALSAAYLAGALKAPVLLTAALTLSNAAASALTRMGATSVHIVGGTSAVGSDIEALLGISLGTSNVVRHAGTDRIATSLAVLAAGAALTKPTQAFVVRAAGSASDGVAAGPIAYAAGVPVLLLGSSVASSWVAAVKAAGVTRLTVLGGTSAVPASVESDLAAAGFTLGTRLAGTTGPDTAALIAAAAVSSFGFGASGVGLARGDAPADALAAAPYAGSKKQPVLLTASPTSLGSAATAFLRAHAATLTTGTAFGGTSAVSADVLAAAVTAAAG